MTREDYAERKLVEAVDVIRTAPKRHEAIHGRSAGMADMVADGVISRQRVVDAFLAVAIERGKSESESLRTINHGLDKGRKGEAWYPSEGGPAPRRSTAPWRKGLISVPRATQALPEMPVAQLGSELLRMTLFATDRITQGEAIAQSWQQMAARAADPVPWPVKGKAGLQLWSWTEYEDDSRAVRPDGCHDDGRERTRPCKVGSISALALDYDDDPLWSLNQVRIWWGAIRYVAHTSAHHNIEKPRKDSDPAPAIARGRVILALSRPVDEAEFVALGQWALIAGRGEMGRPELANPRRAYYVPAATPGYETAANMVDAALDVDAVLEIMRLRDEEATEAEADLVPEPAVLQALDWIVPIKGEPRLRPSLRNILIVLEQDSRLAGSIREDVFTDSVRFRGEALTDAAEVDLTCWLDEVYGLHVVPERVHQALVSVAAKHAFNPVREYLDGLVWDGVDRLDTWLVDYAGCREDENGLTATYGRMWMIAGAARIYEPGCQADIVLVLAGGMGLGKTSVLRILGGAYHSESPLPIGSDEAAKKLAGVWVYELGELASVARAMIEAVKTFITTKEDRFRPSYGRNQVTRPRRCIFAGTTNDVAFLSEQDRRWLVRPVVEPANLAALTSVRDQLWAEAVHRYKAGERWHLGTSDSDHQRDDVDQYRQIDAWEQVIGEWLVGKPAPVTSAEVLTQALKRDVGDISRSDEMRVCRALTALGRRRVRKMHEGRRTYWWE